MSILAAGTVAIDTIHTPFGQEECTLGGSATYIGLAARFFEQPTGMLATVGGDFPRAYWEKLESCGLDLNGIEVRREEKTFAWGGRYHYDLNERETLFTHLNVLESFNPVVPEAYRGAKVVCLGNLDPDIQYRILDQTTGPEMVICDTMNYWIENTPDGLRRVLERVDCLIVNDSEARELSGEPNLVKAAKVLKEMGPQIIVVKKGEHGALLFANGVIFSAPAYPLEDIWDPTGAGDAFMGGFAGYLAKHGKYDIVHLKRAVIYGSTMASFTVEEFGPQRLFTLNDRDIRERINAFLVLSSIPISPYTVEM